MSWESSLHGNPYFIAWDKDGSRSKISEVNEYIHVIVCFDGIPDEGGVEIRNGFFIILEVWFQLAFRHQIEGRSSHSCLNIYDSETLAHQIAALISMEAVKLRPWLATERRTISNWKHWLTSRVVPPWLPHRGAILVDVLVEAIHEHQRAIISPDLGWRAVGGVEPQLSSGNRSNLLIARNRLLRQLLLEKVIWVLLRLFRRAWRVPCCPRQHNCWWWLLPRPHLLIHCLLHLCQNSGYCYILQLYFIMITKSKFMKEIK